MAFEDNVRAEWPAQADMVLGLIRGHIAPETVPAVAEWVSKCYNPPSTHELIACALNDVLSMHGVEAAFEDGAVRPYLEWLNAGDAYAITLVYRPGRGWRVGCYADFVREA